jgi:hypothetical protein
MAKDIQSRLHATGDQAAFLYNGRDARLCDFTFQTNVATVRGYDVFIDGKDSDYVLLSYAPTDVYNQFHDVLLSALDSFSSGGEGLFYPGPVSQFYRPLPQTGGSAPGGSRNSQTTTFDGNTISLPFDKADAEASQVVIEREARILEEYGLNGQPAPGWEHAWGRYYRTIYRDNYHRLDAVAEQIGRIFNKLHYTNYQKATKLLSWLQGFHYVRTDTISDLESPVSCVLDRSGDCDSLGMTYAILLHHLGIDAILMVSLKYSHSMVGVDVPGAGARFSFDTKDYLVAELTAPVAIGKIAQGMSDKANWMGVKLTPPQ